MNEEMADATLNLVKALDERLDVLETHLHQCMSDVRAASLATLLLTHANPQVREALQSAARIMVDNTPEELQPMLRDSFKTVMQVDV